MAYNEPFYGHGFQDNDIQYGEPFEDTYTYADSNYYGDSRGDDVQFQDYNQHWSNDARPEDDDMDNIDITNLKQLPVNLGKKKYIKSVFESENIMSTEADRLKTKHKNKLTSTKSNFKSALRKISIWRRTLKQIEMRFGTGIMLYFEFIKWLMLLNLFTFILSFSFLIVPSFFDNKTRNSPKVTLGVNILMDLFQGTGILENTLLFYGYYSNETLQYKILDQKMYYNIPLVYVLLYLSYLLVCLGVISMLSAKQFKERLTIAGSKYSNIIFGRWTFSINNLHYAEKRHKAIYGEIINTLELNTTEEARKQNILDRKRKIIALRVTINILVILILIGSAFAVYIAFDQSVSHTNEQTNLMYTMLYQFLPSLTIVLLNKIVPILFQLFIKFEYYSDAFGLRLTLLRMVFLRMFSLCIIYAALYSQIMDNKGANVCWETRVGQEMYKLALTEFIVHILSTLILGSILSKLSKYISFLANSTFDLPKNVLDVVFLQTISWFGGYYSPLLPLIFTIVFFFMFYIKKFACSLTTGPNVMLHQTSQSTSMFMSVLLISLGFAGLPVIFSIGEMEPSGSCGPFIIYKIAWDVIPAAIGTIPSCIQSIFNILESISFVIPLFFVLCLTIYYYTALLSTNQLMISDMKKQMSELGSGKIHLKRIYKQFESARN